MTTSEELAAPPRFEIGTELPAFERTVTAQQVEAYAEASGDPNPIHLNEEFAKMVGLPGRIAHGMLEMAILAEAVGRWGGGYKNVTELSCRFSKPLLMGETISCHGKVVGIDGDFAELELNAVSSRGEKVLTNGRAKVRLHA